MSESIEIHLVPIRTALRQGNAAVMIGAGFSFNAENGNKLKTWLGLAKALYSELHPTEPIPDYFGASDVLKLAEEYEQVRSRASLDDFLREHLPDEKIAPGILHQKLLDLSWAEIFTTNYDTLLERAAENIVERAHFTVLSREDIPRSRVLGRRRIVKLHGSFPSQRPFIFTEEDYRRYPAIFSPFVNLVRQSLLENVFCLIGFSGDDPNFLQWIGWVRDMLDKHTLPIYLFLLEEPSYGQRKLLESRHICPVVLPKVEPQIEEDKYSVAYSKLFELLSDNDEKKPEDWPPQWAIPEHAQDLDARYVAFLDRIHQLKSYRRIYPGWLIAPFIVRKRVQQQIERSDNIWFPWILERLEQTPVIGIVLLEEHGWWQKIILQPTYDPVAECAMHLLTLTEEIASGVALLPDEIYLRNWDISNIPSFREIWLSLAMSVLRWCREQLKISQFDYWSAAIEKISGTDPRLCDEIKYEKILLFIYQGESDKAEQELLLWQPHLNEPYMLIRKGALLAEVGLLDAGERICIEALKHIRRNERLDPDSHYLMSREAWASFVAHNIRRSRTILDDGKASQLPPELPNLNQRLSNLALRNHDPRNEVERLEIGLNSEAPTGAVEYTTIEFDLNSQRTGYHFGTPSALRNKTISAFAWLSLIDSTGYVPRIGNTIWSPDSLKQAAWWIKPVESIDRVLSLLIRLQSVDVLEPQESSSSPHTGGWFSRYEVASLNYETAQILCNHSLDLADRNLSKITSIWDDKSVAFHFELYSRLVLRETDGNRLLQYVERLLQLYSDPRTQKQAFVWEKFGHAFMRTLEALSKKQFEMIIPRLLALPELDATLTVQHHFRHWPEWSFVEDRSIAQDSNLTASVHHNVNVWLNKLNTLSPNAHQDEVARRIWSRIYWCKNHSLFDSEIIDEISIHIWRNKSAWPVISGLMPIAPLHWAPPKEVNAQEMLLQWLFSQEIPSVLKSVPNPPDTFLLTWLDLPESFTWTDAQLVNGIELIRQWWLNEWTACAKRLNEESSPFQVASQIKHRFRIIDKIFAKYVAVRIKGLSISNPTIVEWLTTAIEQAKQEGIQFSQFRITQSMISGQVPSEVVSDLILAFIGNDEEEIYDAANAVAFWAGQFHEQYKNGHNNIPNALLDSMAAIVATRKTPALPKVLEVWNIVTNQCPTWLLESNMALITFGMSCLYDELSYGKQKSESNVPNELIPQLRLSCAKLALSLRSKGFVSEILQKWITACSNDPLPEMRLLTEPLQTK